MSWVGGCLFGSLAAVVADDLVDLYDDVLGDAGLDGSAIDHLCEVDALLVWLSNRYLAEDFILAGNNNADEITMDALREGDVVIITELSRLSRSVKDLFEIVDRIHNIGADIKSLKESWIDTTTPQGKLLFTIFAGISQFERDLIRQRTIRQRIC